MSIYTSILSNLPASNVRSTLNKALESTANSSARIGSGKRIVKASDDAASAAVVTGFVVARDGLEVTKRNAATGKSVASMIDGALQQTASLLQRQKALSTQANSGAYSDVERGYLNQEVQQLVMEQDRMVNTVEFNGIKLLDGSLAGGGAMTTSTTGTSAQSSIQLQFSAASATAADTNIFTINGVQFATDTTYNYDSANNALNFKMDDTAAQKATELANIINNTSSNISHSSLTQVMRDRLSGLSASASGGTVTITSKHGGAAGMFTASFDAGNTSDIASIQAGTTTLTATGSVNAAYASGSTTGGLGVSNVSVVGTVGNSIVQSLSQTKATSGWVTVASSDLANSSVVNAFGRSFTIMDAVTNPATQIKRNSASALQTLQNVATFLNNSNDPDVANYFYEVRQSGANAQIRITAKGASAYHNGVGFAVGSNSFSVDGSSGGTSPANGATGGLDVSHITDNTGFYGTVSGFTASMSGSNALELTVQVGDYTYQGSVANTAPTANTIVRMASTDISGKGGYFDVTIAANQGVVVASQTDANTFASNVDAAIKELTFYQTRDITSFKAAGTSIEGSTASLTAVNFNLNVQSIEVRNSQASSSQQAKISIVAADGRVFENTTLGEGVTQGQRVVFTNVNNSNESINIIFGRNVDLSDQTSVNSLQSDLLSAFSANKHGMQFQVGLKSEQIIAVNVDDVSTKALFNGKTIDITTIAGAQNAADVLDGALNQIKGMRAAIGAFQSRFAAAEGNIESSQRAFEEAISVLQDADIAAESTIFAQSEVLARANTAMLSKLNQLSQDLLRLLS
ncbi:MAG: hypothetical protein JSS50_02645 [Proteobacteria bacterium]|nr:hypothetical protein [Pseudomonadota bacterium]